jgi:hypothetical protein
MKKLALLLGVIALAAAPCSNAFADDFTFTYAGPELSASGVFSVTPDPSQVGAFFVSSISGTGSIDGTSYDITGLLPANSYFGNDNELFTGTANDSLPFDFFGLAFGLSNGDDMILYSNSDVPSAIAGPASNPFEFYDSGTASAAFTPEPESLTLLGTGVLALAGLVRRRVIA